MTDNLANIASEMALKGGSLSSSERYSLNVGESAYNDDCDCHDGDCSDCYCTDCNECGND